MAPLAGSVTNPMVRIEYNGVVLTGPSVRATFKILPQKDTSGRTTVGNLYECTVRAIVTDDLSTGNTQTADPAATIVSANKIRTLLTKAGGELTIANAGVDLTLNNQTAPIDLNWGPITKQIDIRNIGGNIAYELVWVFEFMIAECWTGSAITYPGVIGGTLTETFKEMSYTVAYSIDRYGLTVRTIEGQYAILLHRSSVTSGGSGNEIPITADQYREQINPVVPLGFERTSSNFQLNEAKDRCRFQITDTQLPYQYAPPPGIMGLEIKHEVSTGGELIGGSPLLQNTISGGFEVAFNYPMAAAWNNILLIVSDRVEKARQSLPADQRAKAIILKALRVTETIAGPRRVEFQWDYTISIAGNAALNVPGKAGLFTLPGQAATFSWQSYRDSMEDYWSQRGLAGLEYQADQERIVSLCDAPSNADLTDDYQVSQVGEGGGSLTNDCNQLRGKYLRWEIEMEFVSAMTGYRHKCMRSASDPPEYEKLTTAEGSPIAALPVNSQDYQRVQEGGTAGITIYIKGRAERIRQRVEAPNYYEKADFTKLLTQTNIESGVQIYAFENKFKNFPGRMVGGCLTYGGNWYIELSLVGNGNDLNTYVDLLEASLRSTPDDDTGKDKYIEDDDA